MERYDVAIIGAGMSGLAAGIRLAHFGKKVCIFERHNAPGGLNSFYAKDGRKFDVGLHAMTNFVDAKSSKRAPLNRILRQLRINRDDLGLCPQKQSRIAFPGVDLRFTNEFTFFVSEIERVFPSQIDGFLSLVEDIKNYDNDSLTGEFVSARKRLRLRISDPLLENMLFCPIMYYGSATVNDMDFGQFAIMFQALFLEGFARPFDGIRPIIRLLLQRYRETGGIRKMKTGISQIIAEGNKVSRLELDNGEQVQADVVLSSAGYEETLEMCSPKVEFDRSTYDDRLAFVETISVFSEQPKSWGWGDDTIVFFNDSEVFDYQSPSDPVDLRSGVICIPNNFEYGEQGDLAEGVVRMTCLANFDSWDLYSENEYYEKKDQWFDSIWKASSQFLPKPESNPFASRIAVDMFTPKTVERFTWRKRGAIYGSKEKMKDGRIGFDNLFLCGTDQGFLGVVGSMVSGIAMANAHALR
ncbi:NAD(P)/FAD-dependent oxidoreductase [Puniceicoccaceae bacterium K14]|nr:NAD(P)/FAD-dependent oxidoreductase [Puniceicoccaceae bacterium K14]